MEQVVFYSTLNVTVSYIASTGYEMEDTPICLPPRPTFGRIVWVREKELSFLREFLSD